MKGQVCFVFKSGDSAPQSHLRPKHSLFSKKVYVMEQKKKVKLNTHQLPPF